MRSLVLYGTNINAILADEKSINLGAVYESVVAQELHAHGFPMFYYDNKKTPRIIHKIRNATLILKSKLPVQFWSQFEQN